MQNKGAIKLFALLLTLCCLFYMSFTWKVRQVEQTAREKAENRVFSDKKLLKKIEAAGKDSLGQANDVAKNDLGKFYQDSVYNYLLDSLNNQKVYDIWITDFTYEDIKKREINLGLDLRGGINVILEVSVGDIIKGLSGGAKDANFNTAIANARLNLGGKNSDFVELFANEYLKLAPGGKLAPFFQTTEIRNKIEYNAPNDKVIAVLREEVTASLKNVENTLRSRITNIGVKQPNIRSIGSESSGRVLVELPGAKNIEKVKTLLERTANLEFWETFDNVELNPYWEKANKKVREQILKTEITVADTNRKTVDSLAKVKMIKDSLDKIAASIPDSLKKKDTTSGINLAKKGKESATEQERKRDSVWKIYPISRYLYPHMDEKTGYLRNGPFVGYVAKADTANLMAYLNHPEVKKAFPKNLKWAYGAYPVSGGMFQLYCLKSAEFSTMKPGLAGDIIDDAKQGYDQFGKPNISMVMKGAAADSWNRLTTKVSKEKIKGAEGEIPRAIAIVMDNIVYSAPGVSNPIPGGNSEISGSFEIAEAQSLASVLKAGKLPAPAKIVASTEVDASLGEDAIESGISSFIWAIIVILVFMVLYYNRAGGIADIALFINIFFIMGVLCAWGEVLTLPGIAGIVLTIGLSVDANILIFERVREELALGKTNAVAIREGFKHAMSSIIDSNVTLLILGIILLVFGSGPIQGFASTLIAGILSSLFAAVILSRVIFEWFIGRKKEVSFDNKMTRNAFKNVSFDFVKRRKVYYAISTIVIALGVFFYFNNKGFNLGIDFKGGRTYQIAFAKDMKSDDVRKKLESLFGTAEITTIGGNSRYKVTTAYRVTEAGANVDKEVRDALTGKLNELQTKYKIEQEQKVGPAIANDILYKAYMAILFSCLLMFLYILIRFKKWQYGLGAVVALFHDVLIVLSCYTIFNNILPFSLEIGQDFIAAILTVMGYTMTETVVVFDRIREKLAESGKTDVHGEERNKLINFALNSTLSRTILTSLTVFFVLLVIFIFGGESIRGFVFALLIGRIIGTYSSLCISTPIVVDLDRKK
jgi:SecD/SecF fusion protein